MRDSQSCVESDLAGTKADPKSDEANQGLGPSEVPNQGDDEYLEALVSDGTNGVLRDGTQQDFGFDLRHHF